MAGLKISTILHITREYGELIGAGGIRDSVKGLCTATAKKGIITHIFMACPRNIAAIHGLQQIGNTLMLKVSMKYKQRYKRYEQVEVLSYQSKESSNLYFHCVNSERFVNLVDGYRPIRRVGVYNYTQEEAIALEQPELDGKAYSDIFEMDVLLIKATLKAMECLRLKPDLIRCHDGHTAFLPLIAQHSEDNYASYISHIPTLTTIHNAGNKHRGEIIYSDFVSAISGVPDFLLNICIHNDYFEPLIAAALFGTQIHTVSENYARELQSTGMDWYSNWIGHKLAGHGIRITGITHGIDLEYFSPSNPVERGLPSGFSPLNNSFDGKKICKHELLKELNFRDVAENIPLLTFVGRIVHQKGFAILAHAIRKLFEEDQNILLVGNGSGFRNTIIELKTILGEKFKERIVIVYKYDAKLSNRILAAGDFCIIPSLFEPCGQIDFIAQLNGNLPIVHHVGGLVKVEHGVTGFSYLGHAEELAETIKEAVKIYREDKEKIRVMQVEAANRVVKNFGWDQVFENHYIPFYQEVIKKAKPIVPY